MKKARAQNMKTNFPKCFILIFSTSVIVPVTFAQNGGGFDLSWSTIDGGGGASRGGAFSLNGTIGQADAGTLSGGTFTVAGGFWSVTNSTAPAPPALSISRAFPSLIFSWTGPADGWVLDQTTALTVPPAAIAWSQVPVETYQTNATHIFINVAAPTGNRFYRLRRP
jgi:hypothetical protein